MKNKITLLIARFFPANVYARQLKKSIGHLFIEYGKAQVVISDAKKEFEKKKSLAVSEFTKLKKSTLEGTRDAVALLKESADEEMASIENKYEDAKLKVDKKVEVVNGLNELMSKIGDREFPLE